MKDGAVDPVATQQARETRALIEVMPLISTKDT